MQRTSTLLAAVLLIAGTAGASDFQWEGTLSLQIDDLPPVVSSVSGLARINGSAGGSHLTTLTLLDTITVAGTQTLGTPPGSDPVFFLQPSLISAFAVLLPQGVRPISGGGALTQGVMPLPGSAVLCFNLTCTSPLSLPLTSGGTRGVGIGGTVLKPVGTATQISVAGAPWTVRTASVTIQTFNGMGTGLVSQVRTAMGSVHGPASGTSSTAAASGVVQLVTPIAITSSPLGATTSGFGVLRVHLVPEPGRIVLLGSGIAALALAGLRRLR